MLKRPEDFAMVWARAISEQEAEARREKAARTKGITWGLALGFAIGLAALAFGLL